MEISLALILDELGFEADTHNNPVANPKFRSAELLLPGQPQYSPGILYICTLSEAIAADKRSGPYFLCVQDYAPEQGEVSGAMDGVAVVNADIGMRELFNRVHRVFVKVAEWIAAMERSTAKQSGFQELLDLSEPIFGNFTTIQDSTFKLIAYTKNIKPPGIVMARLVEYGFQPPETMELFRRYRRLEEFKRNTNVIVSRDRVTSESFDVVKKTFHLGGSLFIIVVMECCKKPADHATVELFGILIEYIKAYADKDIAQTGGIAGVKSLALDILENKTGSKEEARVRSAYCGFPFEGRFRLYVFSFEDEENLPIAQLVHTLADSCGDVVTFYYSHYILMIEFERADTAETCKSAEKALAGLDFACGISDSFDSLWDLPKPYEQAVIALKIMKQLKTAAPVTGSGRFRAFSDLIVHCIVSASRAATPDLFENTMLMRCISALKEYDIQHRTETVRILRLFLEYERSATTVASLMHMHRNTVLYHIEKISNLLGVSLDDPDTRLQLLLAFKADDFR